MAAGQTIADNDLQRCLGRGPFVFAAGLSFYFVLSLFPLLISMGELLGYVPILIRLRAF